MDFVETGFMALFFSLAALGLCGVCAFAVYYPIDIALEKEHLRYHQEHKDAFNMYCSRCGKTGYVKNDTKVTLAENDNAITDQ
jgi:hypothetical protein